MPLKLAYSTHLCSILTQESKEICQWFWNMTLIKTQSHSAILFSIPTCCHFSRGILIIFNWEENFSYGNINCIKPSNTESCYEENMVTQPTKLDPGTLNRDHRAVKKRTNWQTNGEKSMSGEKCTLSSSGPYYSDR